MTLNNPLLNATALNQDQAFILEVCKQARALHDAIVFLAGEAQTVWTARDYDNTLPAGEGVLTGIAKAELSAVVFDTANAIETAYTGGHQGNVAKILF